MEKQSVSRYQKKLFIKLLANFKGMEHEWSAFNTLPRKYLYAPRVDIAISPFNDNDDVPKEKKELINKLVRQKEIKRFIEQCHRHHLANLRKDLYEYANPASLEEVLESNNKPRCLIAIEIENTNSKKHIMGSVVNAASLGKIGIGIAYSEEAYRAFLRIINYFAYLFAKEKGSYNTANFLVLRVEQFEEVLQETKGVLIP